MNENKIVNRFFWIIAAAVALIAAGSFTWSFVALWELAEANSNQAGLGWIWPLITDLSMVIYTGAILVAQVQRRPARLPIALTILYSVVTVVGNVVHSPQTPLGWFVGILPPLSLVFGTEMLRSMGHHIIERAATVATLAELAADSDRARAQLAALLSQKDKAAADLEMLRAEIKTGKIQQKAASIEELNAARQAKIEARRGQVLDLLGQRLSQEEIAGRLGVSVRTVRNDVRQLNGKAVEAQL